MIASTVIAEKLQSLYLICSGVDIYVIHAQSSSLHINSNANSTHIEDLRKFVVERGLDVGFAYDGDADRSG